MRQIILLFPLLGFWGAVTSQAQLPTACGGGSSPAIACNEACISCNFDGYSGSTEGYPTSTAVDFCGTVENAQWLGFIAGDIKATFTITPNNCSDGNGVQVALYQDCTKAPLACQKGEKNGGMLPVSISLPLTPGANYFLLIDGYAGDQCDFSVDVTPKQAVYEPPLGIAQGLEGPTRLCPGAQFDYSLPQVYGASAYIWTGPTGTLFDSLPSPAVIPGGNKVRVTMGTESGDICVQAANTCKQNPTCSASLFVEVLTDADRPVIEPDSLYSLNCLDEPLALHVDVVPLGDYTYLWESDSSGHIVSGANTLKPRVDVTGRYSLLVTNRQNGCAASDTLEVVEPNAPSNADLQVTDVTCYGDNNGRLSIGGVTGGTSPFLFSLDDAPFSNKAQFIDLKPGDHTLLVQGIDGCEWDTTFAVLEPAELLLDLGADTTLHLGRPIVLFTQYAVNYPERIDEVRVTPPILSGEACDTCEYWPTGSIRYHVTVLDSNGCKAYDERIVLVDKERYVFIPNAFAPEAVNGNERFNIYGGEDVARIHSLRVFNRWGKSVFERYDFFPGDDTAGWDGMSGSDKAPPEVYVYAAEIEFKDGQTLQYQGSVTLIR